ncbi:MAG: hypothetical protein KJ896_04885, partial [Nanoarchaeota archaeon]|nr:hypothetical protein [Nanoarchaeota archaeon]
EIAESFSVGQQIYLADRFNFRGHLHIAHVSTKASVELIDNSVDKVLVTCGVTPHHLLLTSEMMAGEDGILYKVNPPLRNHTMMSLLRQGKIDIIESDHAPHTLEDKLKRHMSGLPGIPIMAMMQGILKKEGFSDNEIMDLMFNTPNDLLGLNLRPRRGVRPSIELFKEYPINPYAHLKL